MKKRILIWSALMLLATGAAWAQRTQYAGTVTFEGTGGHKEGNTVVMHTLIDLDNLQLHRQQMLTLTPVLRSLDRTQQRAFAPVVIIGKTRNRVIERAERLDGFAFSPVPQHTVVYDPRGNEPVPLRFEILYEPWMRQAELVMVENVTGCLNETVAQNEYRTISGFLPPVFVPDYAVAYATPPVEQVKTRSESHTARINFAVGRYDIRRNYMNNEAVLSEVDAVIREVQNDPNLTINDFRVTGYASPEGSAASNLTLSERRARAFVDYIRTSHTLPADQISVDWKGDDWNGLAEAMRQSNFPARNRVLEILEGTADPARRKEQLKALGADYRTLLRDYYPALRRNEYTIGYVARAFSVEEARGLIHNKPQQLSLNEMFLVANSYPEGSAEFKNVFDVASRLFPQDPYARLNSAAIEIENGAYDTALQHLQGIDLPEAWNNIGLIHARRKDYARASEYFNRAASAGSAIARRNLEQLEQWHANPE